MQAILEELRTRSLADVPTDKLLDILLKFGQALREEFVEPRLLSNRQIRQLEDGTGPELDSQAVAVELGQVLQRYKAGLVDIHRPGRSGASPGHPEGRRAGGDRGQAGAYRGSPGGQKLMATKADVKAILKSGKLTGGEAARIVVQHYVDQDHKRGPLLTANEIERVKKAVARRPAEEVDLYNAILEAYRLSEYTLREAHIMALDILLHLEWAKANVNRVQTAWLLHFEQHRRPAIVTEKQFADLKARQRERKLQVRHCLNEVIACRTGETAEPGSHHTGCELLSDEEFDRAFDQASQEIADLIAEGKLQLVETDFRADDDRIRYPDQEPPPGFETVHWWPEDSQCWSSDTPDEEVDRQLRPT